MAQVTTGWNDVSSTLRDSHEFEFGGGQIVVVVTDIASATPNWDTQVEMPDGTWVRIHAGNGQVDQSNPFRSYNAPAGNYRIRCDQATNINFQNVKIYWSHRPNTNARRGFILMAIQKGYRQIVANADGDFDFEVEGAGVIVFTNVTGTWQLDLIAPDDEAIPLIDEIDCAFQQTFNAPADTNLKLSGGTTGNLFIGLIITDFQGLVS